MYKTYPKAAIAFALAMLALAFGLPLFAPMPPFVQTAGGLHLALLIWAMFVLRLVAEDGPDNTWARLFGLLLAIVAAATALGTAPDDGFAQVAVRAGGVAVLAGLGISATIFFSKQHPIGWTSWPKRSVWITLLIVIVCVLVWFHGVAFRQSQGTALMCSLSFFAICVNIPAARLKEFATLQRLQRISFRVILGCIMVITIASIGSSEIVQTGVFALEKVGFQIFMGVLGATLYFNMMLWADEQA